MPVVFCNQPVIIGFVCAFTLIAAAQINAIHNLFFIQLVLFGVVLTMSLGKPFVGIYFFIN
jgi:hypothetical protein